MKTYKAEFESEIMDGKFKKWNFYADLEIEIDDGQVEIRAKNITLLCDEPIIKLVRSMAEMPKEFHQTDVNLMQVEINDFVHKNYADEIGYLWSSK